MKKHTIRPDGFQSSNDKFLDKRKMKWVKSLRIGDNVTTCSGAVETIKSIDTYMDELSTVEGNLHSPFHCCAPVGRCRNGEGFSILE